MRLRSPRFPRSSGRAWSRARRCSATRALNHPDNWVGGLASPDLHAIVILFARDDAERERCQAEHAKLICAVRRRRSALVTGSGGNAAVRLCARPLRLPRPAVAAGHRRHRRGADARLRRAAQAGRVHPRLSGRRRAAGQSAAARDPLPQRQLHGVSPAARSMSASFAISCASTATRPRSRNWSPRS